MPLTAATVRRASTSSATGVVALAAGTSPVLLGVSPWLIPAGVAVGLSAIWLSSRPEAALRVALVAVLLPPGLLPAAVQSALDVGSIALAVLAWLLVWRQHRRSFSVPGAVWLLAAFILWCLLVLFWTEDVATGTDLLRRYVLALLLLLLVLVHTTDRAALDELMDTLAVAAWGLLLLALLAAARGQVTADGRLAVFAMNANQVGNVLLLLTPGVLWRVTAPGAATRARTVQTALFLPASLVVILLTGSRGSLIAYGALLLSFAAIPPLRRWGLAAAAFAAVLVLLAPGLFGSAIARFLIEDPAGLPRTLLWSAGVSVVADNPLGVGLGAGPTAMPAAIDKQVAQDLVAGRQTLAAHNPLIEIAMETGVIGGGLYAGLLVAGAASFVGSIRSGRRRYDPDTAAYAAVVGSCSVAFLSVWAKSGGESYNFTTFVLVALWLVPARALSERSA